MTRVRDFHGQAAGIARASLDEAFALVAAVDRYPEWCPDVVTDVEVLERAEDGSASKVRMRIRVQRGTFAREFDLYLVVVAEPPATVRLARVTDHPTNQEFDATWSLTEAQDGTRIALVLDAKLRVPWYIGAHGIPDAIAGAFVSDATRALSAAPQQ
jgi:ribosome-associated toxin RatA of RatAB toxin-antitoxin module